MSKFSLKVLLGGSTFLFLLVPLFKVQALTIENIGEAKSYSITNDIEDDLVILGGNNVSLEGDVNGDLIILSGNVNVTGNVEGNVYILGNEVKLSNIVGKSVYALGGMVEIEGDVMRDVFAFSDRVTLSGLVGEDLNAMGRSVVVNAVVGDDLRVGATTARINNAVGDNVIALVSNLQITGTVGGEIFGHEDFALEGKSIPSWRDLTEGIMWTSSLGDMLVANLWMKTFITLFQSIGLVLVGILLFKFAPIRLEETISRMNDAGDFVKSAFTGFMAYPVGFVLGFMLIISLFGWPLLKVLVLLAGLATALVTPVAGIWLGRKVLPLFGSKRKYVVAVTLGVVLIQLLKIIPIFGWIFYQILTFAVIGAMLRMQWSKYKVAQNLSVKMRK